MPLDPIGLFALLRDIVKDAGDAGEASLDELTDRIEPDANLPDWPEVFHPKLRKRQSRRTVGRATEMLRLAEMVEGEGTSVITAIQGAGGIGKTTLALEFLRFGLKSHRVQGIWVVNAETPSGMIEDILELGEEIGISSAKANETAAQRVLAAVAKRKTPWLILYDNAPDRTSIDPYLIEGDALRYIVTSRDRDWPDASPLALDVLSEEAALDLLRAESGREEDFAGLAKALDRLPLALVIAGAFLRNAGEVTVDGYLSMLDERLDDTGAGDYPKSVKAAIDLSVDRLGDDAVGLLSLAAYLSPDDVWMEMIENEDKFSENAPLSKYDWPDFVKRIKENPTRLQEAVAALEQASLLKRDGEGVYKRLTLHRLTQIIMRARLGNDSERWVDAAARIVNSFTPDDQEPAHWEYYARIVPQVESLYDTALPSVISERFFGSVCLYLHARGDYVGAIHLGKKALEISGLINDDMCASHAMHLNNIARAYEHHGDLNRAHSMFSEAQSIIENSLGDHPQTATLTNNIASLHMKFCEFEKAEPLLKRAEYIDRVSLGEGHPLYCIDLGNLGILYKQWSDFTGNDEKKLKLADVYLNRALTGTRNAVGEMHPNTAQALSNLATYVYSAKGAGLAIPLGIRAVAIWLDILGSEHPNTLNGKDNLASIFAIEGYGAFEIEEKLQKLPEERDAARIAHVKWGAEKAAEISKRYGIDVADFSEVSKATYEEVARLRDLGEPQEKFLWPLTEFQGAVFAIQQAREWDINLEDFPT